jgi:hypothetical protein
MNNRTRENKKHRLNEEKMKKGIKEGRKENGQRKERNQFQYCLWDNTMDEEEEEEFI